MALITTGDLRERAATLTKSMGASASRILAEDARADAADAPLSFDVFLSHSKADESMVLGAKRVIEEQGLTVYVDWIDDSFLNRADVSASTADTLRGRMAQCKGLIYLHSVNSPISKWMPWELGYFDGKIGRVGIMPVEDNWKLEFAGQEYLGLYPYIDFVTAGDAGPYLCARLKPWILGEAQIRDRTPRG